MTAAVFILFAALQVNICAFECREFSPLMLFPYPRASVHVSTPETLCNPAALPLVKNSYLALSGSNPYTFDGLYSTSVRMGHGNGMWGARLFWDRTGIEGYSENACGADAGILPVKYIAIGIGAQYLNLDARCGPIDMTKHLGTLRAGILIRPIEWLNVAFLHENIMSYWIRPNAEIQFPEWSLGASVIPLEGIEINWNINSTAFGYVNTISVSADLIRYCSFSAGYSLETSSYAAAVSVIYKYVSASYGIRYHTYLGFTHSISLTCSLAPMEVRPVSWQGILPSKPACTEKIDINACAAEDLAGLPGLSDVMISRIMKYREIFGALTRKSLSQIGMTGAEIDRMLDCAYGLEEEKRSSFQSRSGRTNRGKNELFASLLEIGVGPESALELVRMIFSGRRDEIPAYLESDKTLSEEKRKEAAGLCARYFSR